MKSAADKLNAISEQGLCTGCGICESVIGKEWLEVAVSINGYERPIVKGDVPPEKIEQLYQVCPGVAVEGLPVELIETDAKQDLVWGAYLGMYRAWAGDPEVRHIGSTGGALTALAQFLLRDNRVDFILHAKASSEEPSFGELHISRTEKEVLDGAGSRYAPTAILKSIHELLDLGQRFAFVGKPCDISALRNLAKIDERVNTLVPYMLTPVCGGYMPPFGLQDFYDREGIKAESVTNLRYRGYGCPGPTKIETETAVHEIHYLDFWGEDESQWHLPFRCKICPDGIGESADIAAADTWVGGSPDRVTSETDLGVNSIITRTEKGEELLQAAIKAGAITKEREIDIDEMSSYQPHQVNKKQVVFDRFRGLALENRLVPKTNGLRLRELAETCPSDLRERQVQGTRDRVRIGKASEPTPRFAFDETSDA